MTQKFDLKSMKADVSYWIGRLSYFFTFSPEDGEPEGKLVELTISIDEKLGREYIKANYLDEFDEVVGKLKSMKPVVSKLMLRIAFFQGRTRHLFQMFSYDLVRTEGVDKKLQNMRNELRDDFKELMEDIQKFITSFREL